MKVPPPARDTEVIHDGRDVDHCLQGHFSPPGAMEAGLGCLCRGAAYQWASVWPQQVPGTPPLSPAAPAKSPSGPGLKGLFNISDSLMGSEKETDRCFRGAEEKLEAWRPEGKPEATKEKPSEKKEGKLEVLWDEKERKEGRRRGWGRGQRVGGPDREGRRPEGGPQEEGEVERGSRARKQCGIF